MKTKSLARSCTLGSRVMWSNNSAARLASTQPMSPMPSAFHRAWRTKWGTWVNSPAPTWCATIGLMAIITPMIVSISMFQIETPSDTPAKSCADAWPAITTSTTAMPMVANCPTRMGHARRHRPRSSLPSRRRDAGWWKRCRRGLITMSSDQFQARRQGFAQHAALGGHVEFHPLAHHVDPDRWGVDGRQPRGNLFT